MKNNKPLVFSLLVLGLIGTTSVIINSQNSSVFAYDGGVTKYSSMPKSIDVHDADEDEIKEYYSSLNSLSISERKGQNLLKNLKPILQTGSKFTTYSNNRYAMMITDRDWIQTPLTSDQLANYNYQNDSTTYPKIHSLYRTDNGESTAVTFPGTHTGEGANLNKEHTWAKSRGFSSNYEKSCPGTDLHHLMLADNNVNSTSHNNYPYADSSSPYITSERITDNYEDTHAVGYRWKDSSNHYYFEPLDQDKGDIARAIFYMVARYNRLGGETLTVDTNGNLETEANLTLTDYTNETYTNSNLESNNSVIADYGNLETLLRWHKLDPVSDYEIHRNNLIDNNYQNNRNPFIDYPEWVDLIWNNTGNNYAKPESDTILQYGNNGLAINGKNSVGLGANETYTADLSSSYIKCYEEVIWSSSNTSIATVSSSGVVHGNKLGEVTITAISKDSSYFASKTIEVVPSEVHVESVSITDKSVTSIYVDETLTLSATVLPSNATNKNISWSSSDTNIATIDSTGKITPVTTGEVTLTVTTEDQGKTDSLKVTIKEREASKYFDTDSIEITRKDSFETATGYGEKDIWSTESINYEQTISGETDIYNTTTYMQINSKHSKCSSFTAFFYNTTKMPGKITNIKVKSDSSFTSNRTWNLYASASPIASDLMMNDGVTTISASFSVPKSGNEISFDITGNYYYFAFGKTNDAVKINSITVTYDMTEYELYSYMQVFNHDTSTVCKADGSTDKAALTTIWNSLNSEFNKLQTKGKALAKDTSTMVNETYKNYVDSMLLRYEHIVKAHNLDNFLARTINETNKIKINNEDNNAIIIISLISLLTLISSTYFILKKKKYN